MDSMSGLLSRFLEWRRNLLTPEHVEKASRRERWKRSLWMLVTTIATVSLGASLALVLSRAGAPIEFVWIPSLVLAFVVDAYVVFPWGVDRFNLVVPWQFRDAEARG
ncbi:hypothetical protein LQ368_05400 [Halobacterium noricense]|uniref:hypothetical protein n=2 Tax=Halobacterium TaxID=2239 RepID=UPI0012FCDAC7|nr:hypothetical protein [Halobacterium noricense]MCG1002875.1 hypothetical protein [Halobacterium noricense]